MENNGAVTYPRRTIIEVTPTDHDPRRRKRKRFKNQKNNHGGTGNGYRIEREENHDNLAPDEVQHIPLELRPVIDAALGYGRRTHALGTLRAARALERIASDLRTIIDGSGGNGELRTLLESVERESYLISSMIDQVYNEPEHGP